MFDFYENHKFICLVTLFLGLTCLASLFQGNAKAGVVTGLATGALVAYLWRLYRRGQ